jgi:Na+/H+-dicarboxylate symporter
MTNTSKGCLWMVGPFVSLFIILSLWAVVSFVIGTMVNTGSDAGGLQSIAQAINMVLGFAGILSVLAVPIGFVVGIVFMVKQDQSPTVPPSEPPTPPTSSPNMMS